MPFVEMVLLGNSAPPPHPKENMKGRVVGLLAGENRDSPSVGENVLLDPIHSMMRNTETSICEADKWRFHFGWKAQRSKRCPQNTLQMK